jgi:hypothetical protein
MTWDGVGTEKEQQEKTGSVRRKHSAVSRQPSGKRSRELTRNTRIDLFHSRFFA